MPSLRLRLLRRLIGPILLLNLAGGALTYMLAWLPAQNAFDQSLLDAAKALGARLHAEGGHWQLDLPPQAEQVLRSDDSDAVFFAARAADGGLIAGDDDLSLAPPPRAAAATASPLHAQAADASMRQEAVRVAVLRVTRDGQQAYVGVAKTLRKRSQIRNATVRALVLLEALFTLASVGLIWFSVGSGLQPLNRMRAGLNARAGDDLSPISTAEVPDELGPVVVAFNGLLDKVSEGARSQQDFLANVAHQLRTPLAGLRTQLEWLAARAGAQDAEAAHSLSLMLSSTERMIRQTNQLLALARAEPSHFEKTRLEPLQLNQLVEEAIQQFVDQASLKQIDLGFDLTPTTVLGDRFLLRDLIDNLIDNALRYTPAFGTVTVSCRASVDAGGLLAVEDSGPGIPPAKREAVFSRFVRLDDKTTGSGLGLAIVRDIATAHGARVSIESGAGGRGALFSVIFPPAVA